MNSNEMLKNIQQELKEACSGFVGKKKVEDAKDEFIRITENYLNNIGMIDHIEVKAYTKDDVVNMELIALDTTGQKFIKEFKERE